jgi:hypothetical protein
MMAVEADEELSSTFEELILLTCLYSWDARIPRKVTRDIFNSVLCSDNDIIELQLLNPGYALGYVWCVIRQIPDPVLRIRDVYPRSAQIFLSRIQGQKDYGSRIRIHIKEFLTQKIVSKSREFDPESSSRTLMFYHPRYRIQGSERSRIRIETLCLTDGFQVKQLLEPKLGPGFSLLDWRDRILSWLPFILVTDSLQGFNLDPEADAGEHIEEDQEGLAGTQETLEDQHR